MPKPQYAWHVHGRKRKQLEPLVAAGRAYCAEPICLMPTRWISPHEPWQLAHDRATGQHRGPAHRLCNEAEGATYGNHHRGTTTPPDGSYTIRANRT